MDRFSSYGSFSFSFLAARLTKKLPDVAPVGESVRVMSTIRIAPSKSFYMLTTFLSTWSFVHLVLFTIFFKFFYLTVLCPFL